MSDYRPHDDDETMADLADRAKDMADTDAAAAGAATTSGSAESLSGRSQTNSGGVTTGGGSRSGGDDDDALFPEAPISGNWQIIILGLIAAAFILFGSMVWGWFF
ncbi:MAG: hypothetical protein HKN94_07615 [Acidimicrobiales bacterium]|nr:hypothetical protein [Acidimicrobiales bacterium]RZV47996.1 MAG: hypothetical protein EX269_03340 [Acidimicrobiales bacterium]